MSERKGLNLTIPADAPAGTVHAVFSTFGKLDKQRDIVQRKAFEHLDGAEVPLIWSHDWGAMPVGKGHIRVQPKQAVFEGQFHNATQFARDAYETVKAMGSLQEYSYGFEIAPDGYELKEGEDGGPIRLINDIARVFEVSAVLVGAGEDTRTVAIKQADLEEKPFPNEHACRLRDPGDFQANTFRRMTRNHDGKDYSVIMGRLKGETTMTDQALRYAKDTWDASAARAHCASHDGSFEAASSSSLEPDEAKVGRSISRRNEEALRSALAALNTVLESLAAQNADAETDDGKDAADAPRQHEGRFITRGFTEAADAVLLCDLLRQYAAWLGAQPLTDAKAAEWAASVSARMDAVRAVLADRQTRAYLTNAAAPEAVYDALKARNDRLSAVLGRSR